MTTTGWVASPRRCAEKMNDKISLAIPSGISAIEEDTKKSGFSMASDHQTGVLLRTLAATKPRGRFLELGTGTGLSTCWILDGMDQDSTLETVDNDSALVDIAKRHLDSDPRVSFSVQDGSEFLKDRQRGQYDLIFADTWPGKYWDLEVALDLLRPSGIYVIDDMLPQDSWPQHHFPKVAKLIETLEGLKGFHHVKMRWSTGIIIVTKAQPAAVGNGCSAPLHTHA